MLETYFPGNIVDNVSKRRRYLFHQNQDIIIGIPAGSPGKPGTVEIYRCIGEDLTETVPKLRYDLKSFHTVIIYWNFSFFK